MSTLQNDMIFESINESFDIRPCFNGVGNWEYLMILVFQKVLDHLMKQLIGESNLYWNMGGFIHENNFPN